MSDNQPIPLGTELRYADQWWTVSMVGITGGERYYWLTRKNEVLMTPAFMIEIPVLPNPTKRSGGGETGR